MMVVGSGTELLGTTRQRTDRDRPAEGRLPIGRRLAACTTLLVSQSSPKLTQGAGH